MSPGTLVPAPRGHEVVLVVDDEDAVRVILRAGLESLGYTVIEAPGGEEALKLTAERSGPLHLLITDIVMPGMSGPELAASMRMRLPGLAVLFLSGYTEEPDSPRWSIDAGDPCVQKPFNMWTLASEVRKVLTGGPLPAGRGSSS